MGTRSRIGVMHGDKVKSVYCHWDGYLAHNGKLLQKSYNSAKANNLVALGDLSSLGPNIGEKHGFDCPDNIKIGTPEYFAWSENKASMCTFYGRDREESGTEFKVAQTFEEFLEQCDNCGAEYFYIMKDGVWYCGTTYENTNPLSKTLTVLSEAIAQEEKETA